MATMCLVSVVLCIIVYASAQNDGSASFETYSGTQKNHQPETNLLSNFLEKIKDVCSCVNVPSDVNQMDIWSMNSQGKALLAYFEPNCLQKKRRAWYFLGGHYKNMVNLSELKQLGPLDRQNKYKIHSFGPDPDSEMFQTICIRNANIAIIGLEMLETDGQLTKPANVMQNDPKSIELLRQSNNRIHFFGLPNFQDFILASEITFTCNNIFPDLSFQPIRSIRASECVMLFSEPNCFGRSTQIQSPGTNELNINWESTVTGPNTLSLLYKSFPDWTWTTKSFYPCNIHHENQGLNVEITEFHTDLNAFVKPQVFNTYKNVCTCDNIPRLVRNLDRWSLNNHDTSMLVYFEENCESNLFEPIWIPAGQSSYSVALGAFRQINELTNGFSKVLSFGPDYNSNYFKTNCIKLYSTIIKFEIIEQNYTEQNVEMESSEKIFRNDSPKDLSRTFTASETVRDSFSVDIGTSLQYMQKVDLEKSFEVENKMIKNQSDSNSQKLSINANISASVSGPWKLLGVKLGSSISGSISNDHSRTSLKSHAAVIREGLRRAYQNESLIDNSRKIATIVENTRSETVSEVITVPACSVQVVYAYVKTVKSKQIKYRALAKISGPLGYGNMTAFEVRKFMDSQMQYAGVFDENTILAYSTTGFIEIEYGVTTLFSTKVHYIPECMERYQLSNRASEAQPPNLLIFVLIVLHQFISFLLTW